MCSVGQYGRDEECGDTQKRIKIMHMRVQRTKRNTRGRLRRFKQNMAVTLVDPGHPWHHLTGYVNGLKEGRVLVSLKETFPFDSPMGQFAYNGQYVGMCPDIVHRRDYLATPTPEPQGTAVTLVGEGQVWHNQPGYLTGHLNGRALVTLTRSFPLDSLMSQWAEEGHPQ